MNKRIKQLAEQCQIETYGVNGELLEIGFDAEKFAELIIRECAEVASDYDGADYIGRDMKKHFGIE